ncbi:MAG: hypothetical protein AB7F86_15460 [Bdellovibrionales bacterium]
MLNPFEAKESGIEAAIWAIVGGAVLFAKAHKRKKKARLVEDMPRSKISSAPQGLVELQGFAWPTKEGLNLPRGIRVVYFSLALQREETRGTGKSRRKEWVTIHTFSFNEPFYVLDGSGLAMVDPSHSEIEFSSNKTRNWNNISKAEQQLLCELFIPSGKVSGFPPRTGLLGIFSNKYRIIEHEIAAGSPLYACGHFQGFDQAKEMSVPASLISFARKVVDFGAKELKNVTALLDKDGDGKVSAEEAKRGYEEAAALAWLNQKEDGDPAMKDYARVYGLMANSENHKLVISDMHEEHLVGALGRRTNLMMFGGAGLVAVGVLLILAKFIPSGGGVTSKPVAAQTPTRVERVSAARAPARIADSTVLHEACVKGVLSSCQRLVREANARQLPSQNVNYYRSVLCQKGDRQFCSGFKR